jgi:hypothetical protein
MQPTQRAGPTQTHKRQKIEKHWKNTNTSENIQRTAASNKGRTTQSTHKPKQLTPPLQPNMQKENQYH